MTFSINLDKAKDIAHNIRRARRDEEFAPHDALIAKQIPGVAAVAAEEARQQIREKYAAIQEQIDQADNLHPILDVLHGDVDWRALKVPQ